MGAPSNISGKLLGSVSNLSLEDLEADVPLQQDFLSIDWYLAWEESYLPLESPGLALQYISLEDSQNKVQGICPFIVRSQLGLKLFSLAGYYYPFRSIIASRNSLGTCSQALVQTLQQSNVASLIRMGPAEESNPITQNINASFYSNGWKCYTIDRGQQFLVSLPDSYEEYKKSVSKKLLGNIRRDTNRLKKLGDVRFVKYNSLSSEEWKNVISDCSGIESRSWLIKTSDGKARIYKKEKFWNRLLKDKHASDRTTVWVMYFDEKPISYNLTIDSGGYRYGVSSQYDLEYRSYSVGLSIYSHVIEDAIQMGIKIFNMGDGDSGFKSRWGAEPGPRLIDYIYFKPNLLGTSVYASLTLKDFISSIVEKCSMKLKRPLAVSLSTLLLSLNKK